jgi:hypothetical protein
VTNTGYDADISSSGVKLYLTSAPVFATTNLLGTAQSFNTLNAAFGSLSYDLPTGHTYIWVTFDIAPGATGFHHADGKIAQHAINVNGTLYPAGIQNPSGSRLITVAPKALPLTEAAWATTPPADWNKIGISWSSSNTSNAGGIPNELKVNYSGCQDGDKMITPPLITTGLPYLVLRFRSYLNNFGAGCTLRVQSSSDGISWTNEAWSLQPGGGGIFGPSDVVTAITSNLSGGITYVAFVLTGNPTQINDWYIDNVKITAPEPPTVLTIGTSSITGNSAVSGGNVTDDAANPVTARGVCWSTLPNPSTSGDHTSDGAGLGTFVSSITGLTEGTTYHIRAYSTNGIGTSYGNDLYFTTLGANVFNMIGGGTYCTGGSGLSVGLDGSEISAEYQLVKNGSPFESPKPGTGSPLSWDNLSDGTYIIEAITTFGTTIMTGSAVISSFNNPVSVSILASANNICSGTSVTFTATPVNGGPSPVYQWKVNGGNVGLNSNQFTYFPNNGDQVICVLTSTASCPTGNPATSNLISMVLAIPLPNLYGSTSECSGASGITYSTDAGTGISNYVWNVSAGATITTGGGSGNNSVTVTWNNPGAQTVSVNYTNSFGCNAVSPTVKNVTVSLSPEPSITGVADICGIPSSGNVYTTEAAMSGYNWSVSSGGIITSGTGTNAITVTWTTTGAKTVSVNYSLQNGCSAANATVKNVNVHALPVPLITGSAAICDIPSSGNLYAAISGMTGYVWSVSPGGTIETGAGTNQIAVTWSTPGPQTVSLTYTDANGCSPINPTVKTVSVAIRPAPSVTGPADLCGLPSAGNVYTTEPGMSGYLWTVSAGGTITSGAGTHSIAVTWTTTGAKTVTVTYMQNGCFPTIPASYPVNVSSFITPTITGDVSVCGIPSTGHVYSTEAGMVNYAWTVSTGGIITSGGTSNDYTVTVDWTIPGAKTVTVVYNNGGGCSPLNPTVKSISVEATPVPVISGPALICGIPSAGNVYTTATGMSGYTWTVSAGGTITSGAGTNAISVDWTMAGVQTVTVNYITPIGCIPVEATSYNVNIHPFAVASITGTESICGVPSTGNIYSSDPGLSGYIWTVSAGGAITAGAGTSAITVTWSNAGDKTVTLSYTDANGCSPATPIVKWTHVHDLPVPVIAGAASVCDIPSAGNVYSTAAGMSAYQWNVSAGGTITGGAGTDAITVSWNTFGIQTVSVAYIDTHGCEAGTASVKSVGVYQYVPVSIAIAASGNPVCSGNSVTFTATTVNAGTSPFYQWKVNGANAGWNSPTIWYVPANNDLVTCEVTSSLPCTTGSPATSNTITMTVKIHPDAPVSGGDENVCSTNLPAVLSATPPAGSTIDWYSNWGSLLSSNSVTYSASTSGNYYAESRDLTTGCLSISRTAVNLTINTAVQYFADFDGDGYGTPEISMFACAMPAGYVTNGLDCDDNNANINPGDQFLKFTGNLAFTDTIVFPRKGAPSTLFHFEADYVDSTNSMPAAGYPRLMLDYEGNGSYLDANDRIVIMTAADPTDVTTNNGKRYFAEVNNLPYGINWTSKVIVGAGGVCSTSFGPFNYPDILHEPNLYIFANDISFNPVHPDPSSPLTVSAVIHNESDYVAQNFVVHMLNQRFPNLVFQNITVANLPAHQNTTVTWNIASPDTAAWCPVQIQVDYTNVIGENNELDNSAVRPFTNGNYQVAGQIVVTSDVSPHSSYLYQYGYLYVYGTANYADFAVPLVDPSVAGATVDFTVAETGASYTGYTNSWGQYGVYIPAPGIVGTYHITVSVTDFTLTGTDTTHFHILPPPPPPPPAPTKPNLTLNYCHAVDITPVNPHSAGGSVNLVAHVVNNGDTTATGPIEVQFTYSSGGTWTEQFAGNLAAGQSVAIIKANVPLPPPGTTLTAYADQNNLVNEWNETAADNSTTDNMCYEYQPVGLCGGNFWGTYCYTPGLTIGLSVGLNVSHLYDANPVKVKFEVSGPGISGWQVVGTGELNNATRNCYCPYAVSCPNQYTFAQVGTFTFRMTADPDNDFPECNETNNVLEVTVNVVNCAPPVTKANLTLAYCHSVDVTPVNPHTVANITLVAHVLNNGNATAVGTIANPIEVTFTYPGGVGTWTSPYVGSLAPGQSVDISAVTPRPLSGTLLTAYVDPGNFIDEWNETDADNSSSDNLCYDFQPVAHCGYNFWSHSYHVGQSASLSVGVNVSHLFDSNPVKVKFEVSGPGISGTQNLGNALLNNASRNCWCPWTVVLPNPFTFFQAGTYHFTMTTDPLNEYTECDETNNVLQVDVTVIDGADMRVLSQFINPTPLNPGMNEPVSLIVSYENIGNSNVNDQMKLKVMVDEVFLAAIYPVPGLATGDHNSIAIPTTWSSNLPGAHAIRAIIDADNQVPETNESNNEATRAIIVGEAANLHFLSFAASKSNPVLQEYIHINSVIGNNGDVNATANVKFFYINNSGDTISIGQAPVSVFAHQSVPLVMPWVVADIQTTIIGKITDVNTLEFNPDDNVATDAIGGFDVSITSTTACFNTNNGTITAAVTGGTSPFFYGWSNGFIGQTLTAGAGTYTVTVTDITGLSSAMEGTITEFAPVSPTISGTSSVCLNSTANVYSTETGMSAYTWMVSPGGIITSGGTGSDHSITITWNNAGGQSVSVNYTSQNGCTGGTQTIFPVSVHPLFEVGSIAANQVICFNTQPAELTGTAPNGGNLPYTFQWQSSPDSVTFANIIGATSLNYSPGALTASAYYRQMQTSATGCGSLTTNMVKISVYPQFVVGSVSTSQMICNNMVPVPLTGIAPEGGNLPYAYQWQISTDGISFENITGATTLDYAPGALSVNTYYRQMQTSANGCNGISSFSNIVTITVNPILVAGIIAGNQFVCPNAVPDTLTATAPTGGAWPYTYQWQSSVDQVTFGNIPGATSINHQPAAVGATTYFRLIQFSTGGCSIATNSVTITVNPLPQSDRIVTGVTFGNGQSICYDAAHTVTVSGLVVQLGGAVNIIAGQNILFEPGTTVKPGGYLHGFITANCVWCNTSPTNRIIATESDESNGTTTVETLMGKPANNLFRVYPNPTTGAFTLELSEISETSVVKVEIYGMQGDKLLNDQFTGEKAHEFSLEGKASGIYFIRVFCGESLGSQKIIKR